MNLIDRVSYVVKLLISVKLHFKSACIAREWVKCLNFDLSSCTTILVLDLIISASSATFSVILEPLLINYTARISVLIKGQYILT